MVSARLALGMVRPVQYSPLLVQTGSMKIKSESILFTVRRPSSLCAKSARTCNLISLGYTAGTTDQMMIAFSPVSTFDVRLPAGDPNTSLLHLVIQIQDKLDCSTKFNITPVMVVQDITLITDLTNNSLLNLLATGNQNTIGQVINSLSQALNRINIEGVQNAVTSNYAQMALTQWLLLWFL